MAQPRVSAGLVKLFLTSRYNSRICTLFSRECKGMYCDCGLCQQVTKEKEQTSSRDKFKRFREIEAIARWKYGQMCALHCTV